MTNEIWKDIEDYEGLYQVSNFGRVKSLNYNHTGKEQILVQHLTGEHLNYKYVQLCKNGKVKHARVHILVAKAFIPNPNNYNQVHHKNKNTFDNTVPNLEWVDGHKHNQIDSGKPVDCFDKNGNLIKHYDYIRQVELDGHCASHVVKCCLNKPKYNTHHGYIWKYSGTN